MGKMRNLLTSLIATLFVTDLLLVAFACIPESHIPGMARVFETQVPSQVDTPMPATLAGGGLGSTIQPAFLGNFRRWLRNCWSGYFGGDDKCRRKCNRLQSRPCSAPDDV